MKHAWIVGSRRSDAPAAKPPANYKEAVEEVKQWNEALKSPNNGSLRNSTRSSAASPLPIRRDPPLRNIHNEQSALTTPARGPLNLAKARSSAEAFRSPETHSEHPSEYTALNPLLTMIGDDNWDNDFSTSISPSALQLPHLKPHDNFGGMFSSDRLKSYASMELASQSNNENWDENFEGDLMTIKPPLQYLDNDAAELDTIRPSPQRRTVSTEIKKASPSKGHSRNKSAAVVAHRPKNPINESLPAIPAKFELPPRPVNVYREQSIDDYSDLFSDDFAIDRRLNLVQKVTIPFP